MKNDPRIVSKFDDLLKERTSVIEKQNSKLRGLKKYYDNYLPNLYRELRPKSMSKYTPEMLSDSIRNEFKTKYDRILSDFYTFWNRKKTRIELELQDAAAKLTAPESSKSIAIITIPASLERAKKWSKFLEDCNVKHVFSHQGGAENTLYTIRGMVSPWGAVLLRWKFPMEESEKVELIRSRGLNPSEFLDIKDEGGAEIKKLEILEGHTFYSFSWADKDSVSKICSKDPLSFSNLKRVSKYVYTITHGSIIIFDKWFIDLNRAYDAKVIVDRFLKKNVKNRLTSPPGRDIVPKSGILASEQTKKTTKKWKVK